MTVTAKLFMNGRSQAVRLPKEFRMAGTEVSVRREGDSIVLEPISAAAFDIKAWLTKLDSYKGLPFPELPDDPALEPDDTIAFD